MLTDVKNVSENCCIVVFRHRQDFTNPATNHQNTSNVSENVWQRTPKLLRSFLNSVTNCHNGSNLSENSMQVAPTLSPSYPSFEMPLNFRMVLPTSTIFSGFVRNKLLARKSHVARELSRPPLAAESVRTNRKGAAKCEWVTALAPFLPSPLSCKNPQKTSLYSIYFIYTG